MTYKTVVLHLDDSAGRAARIDAVHMARRHAGRARKGVAQGGNQARKGQVAAGGGGVEDAHGGIVAA